MRSGTRSASLLEFLEFEEKVSSFKRVRLLSKKQPLRRASLPPLQHHLLDYYRTLEVSGLNLYHHEAKQDLIDRKVACSSREYVTKLNDRLLMRLKSSDSFTRSEPYYSPTEPSPTELRPTSGGSSRSFDL